MTLNADGTFSCDDPESEWIREEQEYQRGKRDVETAQQAGPPGSPEREAAYREMEAQWEREGHDG